MFSKGDLLVVAVVLVTVGALNWGLIGAAKYNLVGEVNKLTFNAEWFERTVYSLVGLSAVALVYFGLTQTTMNIAAATQ
jgi:uncharacterized membrane protein YuzA (DUF378 family)